MMTRYQGCIGKLTAAELLGKSDHMVINLMLSVRNEPAAHISVRCYGTLRTKEIKWPGESVSCLPGHENPSAEHSWAVIRGGLIRMTVFFQIDSTKSRHHPL